MARRLVVLFCFGLGLSGATAAFVPRQAAEPPRLVVLIPIDQMRADYLDRFGDRFTGGLARFLRDGARFTDARQDHAVTETAPGHAVIATGVYPNRNGMVANNWWDRVANRSVYAVSDTTAPILGDSLAQGRSPAHLLSATLGDWLKKSSPNSKVYAIALKDRVAVIMGGQRPDGAYWYHDNTGWFVTSRYYRDAYPRWLLVFNDSGPKDSFFADGWVKAAPEDAYSLSREDAFAAENDGIHTTFPHAFEGEAPGPRYYAALPYTPFGDELTFALARDLIRHEALGADDAADLLVIGASAADFVGHTYGPYSQEVEDYYLRLDAMLEEFFAFLDEQIGPDRYIAVLTSDHGVVPVPEESLRRGLRAHRVDSYELQDVVLNALTRTMERLEVEARPSLSLANAAMPQLAVRFPDGGVTGPEIATFRRELAANLRNAEIVEDVFTFDELERGDQDRPYIAEQRRSFHPSRAYDLVLLLKKYYLDGGREYGTTHGTPYSYDTRIPLVFYGKGITRAEYGGRVRAVDIAPTVSRLLGVRSPPDLDGHVLQQVVASKQPDRR